VDAAGSAFCGLKGAYLLITRLFRQEKALFDAFVRRRYGRLAIKRISREQRSGDPGLELFLPSI
jgi:hypothetical protein